MTSSEVLACALGRLVAVVLAAAIGFPETDEVDAQAFEAAGNSIGRFDVPAVR